MPLTTDELVNQEMKKHFARYNWNLIPAYMHNGVKEWVEHGRMGGSFIEAVILNKFSQAVCRADQSNLNAIVGWAKIAYNYFPTNSYGSEEKVKAWTEAGGLRGKYKAELERKEEIESQRPTY